MPFTRRNDHSPRFANGPARPKCNSPDGTSPGAIRGDGAAKPRLRQLTHSGRLLLPEGRTGLRVCPGLRHALLKLRRAATNRRTTNYNKSRKTAWRKRIGSSTPTKTTRPTPPTHQKARTCNTAPFRKKTNGATMPNREGQPQPKAPQRTCPPDALLLFLRLRPTSISHTNRHIALRLGCA
jgi:hypothetical protein